VSGAPRLDCAGAEAAGNCLVQPAGARVAPAATCDHGHPAGDRHAHGPGQAHGHAHGRTHDHHREAGRRGLLIVLVMTATFMVVEFIGGVLSNSLALIADSAHMLSDVAAVSLSLLALGFARRPATAEKTYGYLRLEILAALVNGVALGILAIFIFVKAYQRFQVPAEIESGLMLGVAIGGLVVNLVAAGILHRSAGHSLNVRGAYLHVLGDLLGSVGAIAAALLIMGTGWVTADPLISVFVGLLILVSSWKLTSESVDILMEAAPRHIDVGLVRGAIHEIPGVESVHDLHVWTVTSGFCAMSVHAVISDPSRQRQILEEIHQRLVDRFGIRHATVQLEATEPVRAAARAVRP